MIADALPVRPRLWLALLLAVTAPLSLLAWDAVSALVIARWAPSVLADEQTLYVIIKAGFVVALALLITICGGWRRLGFRGGPAWSLWFLMLPAWLSAALSLLHGVADITPSRALGWLGLGVLIGLGEETIFRGIVLNALGGLGARPAIIGSSLLFGTAHLAGIVGGVDIRMVVVQVVYATGLGISFAWVRVASGSIWPCIAAHAAMDGIGLIAADGVGNALRYESDGYIAAIVTAIASLLWGVFLLSRRLPVTADMSPEQL